MAEAILGVVLEKLTSLAVEELRSFMGFNTDLEKLRVMLTSIEAILDDAAEKQFSSQSVKYWLEMLKDASYELNDILDECAELTLEYQGIKCGSYHEVCSCLSYFRPKHAAFHYTIAKRMKSICERLDTIAEERYMFQLTAKPPRSGGVYERLQTTSVIVESRVYGREEDEQNIVDFLMANADVHTSRSNNLSVYPIVGLGGLGKTTLARLIFNHVSVVNHFDARVWICVTEDFDLNKITKAIIGSLSLEICEDLELESLLTKVQDLLQNKRYLLVLDDVCDYQQEKWLMLKSVLACGAMGASILITTRLLRVAAMMGTVSPHELSYLSDNDCWKLFKEQAFQPGEIEQEELVNIGMDIVKKCGGVPLAAKVLGAFLRFNREESTWTNVKNSDTWKSSQGENSIMPALILSYSNLPHKVRQCLVYCAIFPKDEIIRKQDLIEHWMANGFIPPNETLDVGDSMWNELYWRSFFQDIETDEFSHVTSFKIHNIVHDLLKFAAEEVCCITNDNDVTVPERIRHISEHSWRSTLDSAQFRFESLRTYLLPPQRYKTGQLSPQVLKCYNLRVLQYEPTETLSSSISRLKHLRYLNVSGGDFVTIPKSLCRLWNLQILKLDHCHRLQKLPKNLIGLKALQKLSLNGCSSLSSLPRQMGKLTSLRNLSMYIVCEKKGFLLAELGPLKLKGDLDIKHLEKVRSVEDAKEAKMSEKQLNRLSLSWDNNEATELQENVEEILQVLEPSTNQLASLSVVGYKGACFPQWMSSSFLKYLELEDCKMCSKLPQLGKLRFLKSLSISKMTPVEYLYEEDSYDGEAVFIALEFLFLKELSNLKRLLKREDGENMFPLLNKLEIAECPNLLGLPSLPSIRNLHIQGKCNQHLLTSVKKLSSLQDLWLEDNEELRFFPDGMFQGLTSLKELYFHRLFKLEIFPTKLPDSLEKLEFVGCHKFVSAGLHEALQNVTALHSLKFEHLPNLASLPDCFQKLALLRELALYNCSKLKCLPASLKFCALKRLDIQGCPELEKRCQEYTGEDWPIISTIPNIRVIPMRR